MILSIILIMLMFLFVLLIIFFIYANLIPSFKRMYASEEHSIFSSIELKYDFLESEEKIRANMKAVVLCSPEKKFNTQLLASNYAQSCSLVTEVYESVNDCKFSCIGLGDCVSVCPQQAIIIENSTAVVTDLCAGCSKCVSVCPKRIIKIMPRETESCILCNNSSDDITTCSDCKREKKIPIKSKKGFKIWQSCYTMFKWKFYKSVYEELGSSE